MAKVSPGSMIADASGSIGTTTFQRTRSGLIIRARVTPANPGTTRQATVRAALATLTTRWSTTLTESQRQAWRNFAQLQPQTARPSTTFIRTGLQQYLHNNMRDYLNHGSHHDTPPSSADAIQVLTVSLTLRVSTHNCAVAGTTNFTSGSWELPALMTAPLSGGRSAPNNTWKYIGSFTGGATFAGNIWAIYTAAWGTPTAGQKTWMRIYPYSRNNGNTGVEVRVGATWAA